MKDFKVGQAWRTRAGNETTITAVQEMGLYPVHAGGEQFSLSGRFFEGQDSIVDLVELIDIEKSFKAFDKSVGDINSDAKGSGARYNTGKPPFDLVPLRLVAQTHSELSAGPAVEALNALSHWQQRDGEWLMDVLAQLGLEGWTECAQVFDYGRAKYAAWNWAKGMQWSVPLACAARHLLAMIGGEVNDPESGLPHRGHVFCNIVMLLTYERTFPEGDDRPAKGTI